MGGMKNVRAEVANLPAKGQACARESGYPGIFSWVCGIMWSWNGPAPAVHAETTLARRVLNFAVRYAKRYENCEVAAGFLYLFLLLRAI